jgi:Fe-Mn family superoxide dismutase
MKFELPKLPYEMNDLKPHLSAETLEFHYGRHHKAYIDKLNGLIEGTKFANSTLEQIVHDSEGAIFNNAAQAWNHTFYWNCITPANHTTPPQGGLLESIRRDFGSLEDFKKAFTQTAMNTFGSGWAWLVKEKSSQLLTLISTSNAETPIRQGLVPILVCDVWEHAYYIDYRNERAKYLEGFWNLINWNYVEKCYQKNEIENLTSQMSASSR